MFVVATKVKYSYNVLYIIFVKQTAKDYICKILIKQIRKCKIKSNTTIDCSISVSKFVNILIFSCGLL